MASSVVKHPPKKSTQWKFCFTSKAKADQGLPRQKWFYFPMHTWRKSDVQDIRRKYEQLYKAGEFEPWTEDITDMPAQKQAASRAISLSKAIDTYMADGVSNLTDYTQGVHEAHLRKLARQMGDPQLASMIERQKFLNDWVNDSDKWNTRRSVKHYIERFFTWCTSKDLIDKAPELSAYSTKMERHQRVRDYLTEQEFEEFLDGLDQLRRKKLKSPHAPANAVNERFDRMRDMFTVMFFMGLRISEALHARPAWIIESTRFLRIGDLQRWNLSDSFTPKSQKEHDHPIAIPPEVQPILKRRKATCTGMYQRLFNYKAPRWVQKTFKDAAIIAFGKDRAKRLSPHSLRHSCASYWVNERKVPVQEVQYLLRHEDISMTMKYRHPDQESHYTAFNSSVMRAIK